MLKVKIINVRQLTYKEEEDIINKELYEIQKDNVITNVVYRDNSVVIEYNDGKGYDERN